MNSVDISTLSSFSGRSICPSTVVGIVGLILVLLLWGSMSGRTVDTGVSSESRVFLPTGSEKNRVSSRDSSDVPSSGLGKF